MAVNPINSGDLRYKVQLMRPVTTQNDEGGTEKSFDTLLTTWAAIRNVSNYRVDDPQALLDTKEFFVRYTENRGLTTDHILLYKGSVYEVTGVEVVQEKQRFIKLTGKNRGGVAIYLATVTGWQAINYTATGGETLLTYAELIGKQVMIVTRSGIGVEIVSSGLPLSNQVLFTSAAGQVLFGAALSPEEWVLILYNG
jgi:head-tail adaptor